MSSFFDDPQAPKITTSSLMSGARDVSAAGAAPNMLPEQNTPWAKKQVPSFMQPQQGPPPAAAQAPAGGGFWPSWLSPAPAEKAEAPAPAQNGNWPAFLSPQPAAPQGGPNMGIPGAQETAENGAPSWIMQKLFGGYA